MNAKPGNPPLPTNALTDQHIEKAVLLAQVTTDTLHGLRRELAAKRPQDKQDSQKFKVSEHVQAMWGDDNQWYSGVIVSIGVALTGNRCYDIKRNKDAATACGVRHDRIRRTAAVESKNVPKDGGGSDGAKSVAQKIGNYKVLSPVMLRKGAAVSSEEIHALEVGTVVRVVEVKSEGRAIRARIDHPYKGWTSLVSTSGVACLERQADADSAKESASPADAAVDATTRRPPLRVIHSGRQMEAPPESPRARRQKHQKADKPVCKKGQRVCVHYAKYDDQRNYVTAMCYGTVERYLHKKKMWGVALDDGRKIASDIKYIRPIGHDGNTYAPTGRPPHMSTPPTGKNWGTSSNASGDSGVSYASRDSYSQCSGDTRSEASYAASSMSISSDASALALPRVKKRMYVPPSPKPSPFEPATRTQERKRKLQEKRMVPTEPDTAAPLALPTFEPSGNFAGFFIPGIGTFETTPQLMNHLTHFFSPYFQPNVAVMPAIIPSLQIPTRKASSPQFVMKPTGSPRGPGPVEMNPNIGQVTVVSAGLQAPLAQSNPYSPGPLSSSAGNGPISHSGQQLTETQHQQFIDKYDLNGRWSSSYQNEEVLVSGNDYIIMYVDGSQKRGRFSCINGDVLIIDWKLTKISDTECLWHRDPPRNDGFPNDIRWKRHVVPAVQPRQPTLGIFFKKDHITELHAFLSKTLKVPILPKARYAFVHLKNISPKEASKYPIGKRVNLQVVGLYTDQNQQSAIIQIKDPKVAALCSTPQPIVTLAVGAARVPRNLPPDALKKAFALPTPNGPVFKRCRVGYLTPDMRVISDIGKTKSLD